MATKLILSNENLTCSVKYSNVTGRYLVTFMDRATNRITGQVFTHSRDSAKMLSLLSGFLPVYICE